MATDEPPRYAFLGVRPCDLQATPIQALRNFADVTAGGADRDTTDRSESKR